MGCNRYIKRSLGTVFHPAGTAAMVPRILGGACRLVVGNMSHNAFNFDGRSGRSEYASGLWNFQRIRGRRVPRAFTSWDTPASNCVCYGGKGTVQTYFEEYLDFSIFGYLLRDLQ